MGARRHGDVDCVCGCRLIKPLVHDQGTIHVNSNTIVRGCRKSISSRLGKAEIAFPLYRKQIVANAGIGRAGAPGKVDGRIGPSEFQISEVHVVVVAAHKGA